MGNLGEIQDGIHVDQITSVFGPSNNHAAVSNAASWKLQLAGMIAQSSTPTCQELSLDFDSHHHLFTVIYLLSNCHLRIDPFEEEFALFEDEVDLVEVVEMLFTFVSRPVLLTLLQSRLPSIKAAWETLLIGSTYCKNKDAFRILITAGIENDWLDEPFRGHQHLYNAVQSNCADLIDALLARGCRTDSSCAPACARNFLQRTSAIMAALTKGDLTCAKVLIQNCDVNREFEFPLWRNMTSNFVIFIANFDGNEFSHHQCLDYFLERGADVDYELNLRDPVVVHEFNTEYYWSLGNAQDLMKSWSFSILDYFYYFHRPVFPKLAAFSQSSSFFNRAKALWCLEQGVHVLREYLQEDLAFARPWDSFAECARNSGDAAGEKKACLAALLAEQFLLGMYRPDRTICYKTVQALLEVGVDLKALSTRKGLAPYMLYATACLIASGEGPDKEQGLHLLQLLLDHGFHVQSDALSYALQDYAFQIRLGQEDSLSTALDHRGFQAQADGLPAAVQAHGVAILELLAGHCTDLRKYGSNALALAISRGNFEAINLLLDKGVDPNATVDNHLETESSGDTIFAAAALRSNLAMMKYLVQRGSRPRIMKDEEKPYELLVNFLTFVNTDEDLFIKIQYITEEYVSITDPSCPSSFILELCTNLNLGPEDRRRTFEYLLNKGAKLSPGSPLAQWIDSGGGHKLIQEMLDAGADPDTYSFDYSCIGRRMYSWFLACRTPLQAAAGIGDYTLVRMLLERGADVNRPAFGHRSNTALQAVCAWDPVRLEERTRKDGIIKLLLAKGADVNAVNPSGNTALTYAAQLGDLSTAFILLKHGARLDAIVRTRSMTGEILQTALDIAAEDGRLDMVALLLNANGLSASAYTDGKEYDGAIQQAWDEGHFAIAEMIYEHSKNREKWDVSYGHVWDTKAPPGQPFSLALRTYAGAASSIQTETRLTPSENIQGVPILDKTYGLCATLDGFMGEGSTSASKAKGKEVIDLSGTRVIEEIEDGSPLADTEWEESSGEKHGRTAELAVNTGRASPRPREWLNQRREQNWVEDEQQNVDPVVSTSLVTDVFMGFSEFASP